jgi:hypothetical protein
LPNPYFTASHTVTCSSAPGRGACRETLRHHAGEADPVGEAVARYGDDHGNVRVERTLDRKAQAFAVALPLAEAIDDKEIGAACERVGDAGARCLKPRQIELAAGGAWARRLGQRQHLAVMDQHG